MKTPGVPSPFALVGLGAGLVTAASQQHTAQTRVSRNALPALAVSADIKQTVDEGKMMHHRGLTSSLACGAAAAAIAVAPVAAASPTGVGSLGYPSAPFVSATHCGVFHGSGVAAQLHRCRLGEA